MNMDNLIDQFVEDLKPDVLEGWADIMKVQHTKSRWLDDEYPVRVDELRVKVAEAMKGIGK